MPFLLIGLIGFVASLGLVGALIPFLRSRIVDVPNGRSSHIVPTPRGGGLGVLLAMLLAGLGSHTVFDGIAWPAFLLAIVAMAGIGLADDVSGLGPGLRLMLQAACALFLVIAMIGPGSLKQFGLSALAVVFIVGIVNAYNFMDGINGISAATGIIVGTWYSFLGVYADLLWVASLGAALAGAAGGFVIWNLPGRVFLGDTGSYLMGSVTGVLALALWLDGIAWPLVVAPMALYVIDTTWTLARRTVKGHPVGVAHRDHTYQLLVDRNLSHRSVSGIVVAAALVTCLGAVIATSMPIAGALVAVGAQVGYLLSPHLLAGRMAHA